MEIKGNILKEETITLDSFVIVVVNLASVTMISNTCQCRLIGVIIVKKILRVGQHIFVKSVLIVSLSL